MPHETLPTPELVLFDWDNTLVDTFPVIKMAYRCILEKLGLPADYMKLDKSAMNLSARDRFPILFKERSDEALAIYFQCYEELAADNLHAFKGAESYLQYLADRQISMGLISNKRGVRLRSEVTEMGWDRYFIASTGAEEAKEDKPSPLIYQQFLQSANIKPPANSKKIWMVGDSQTDILFAVNIEATPIYIGDIDDFRTDFGDDLTDSIAYHCSNVVDMKKILRF